MKYPSGSVIGIFGLPCSGKTTIIEALTKSSKEIIAKISSGDIARQLSTDKETAHMAKGELFPYEEPLREEISRIIEARRVSGAGLILLDGFPRFDEQVHWMVEKRYAGTQYEGCLIQVIGDDLYGRARFRARDDQDEIDKIVKKIENQKAKIAKMEEYIFRMGVPYFTIVNTDLIEATVTLTKALGIRK
jgi:adenylate kinase family enzyme